MFIKIRPFYRTKLLIITSKLSYTHLKKINSQNQVCTKKNDMINLKISYNYDTVSENVEGFLTWISYYSNYVLFPEIPYSWFALNDSLFSPNTFLTEYKPCILVHFASTLYLQHDNKLHTLKLQSMGVCSQHYVKV